MTIAWLVSKLLISVESLFFLDFFRFRSEFTILSILDIICGSTTLRISIALWLYSWFQFSKFFECFSSDSLNFSSKFLFWRRMFEFSTDNFSYSDQIFSDSHTEFRSFRSFCSIVFWYHFVDGRKIFAFSIFAFSEQWLFLQNHLEKNQFLNPTFLLFNFNRFAIYLYMPKNHLRRLRPCATHSWNQKSATDFSNSRNIFKFKFSLNLLSWLQANNSYFL